MSSLLLAMELMARLESGTGGLTFTPAPPSGLTAVTEPSVYAVS